MMAEMSLRVLQVITDPTRRGAQLFAVDLGDVLARRGIEVRTVALAATVPLAPESAPPLDVPTLGARRVAWSTLVALRREVGRADVVVAHGAQTLPACALATLAQPTPFVYRQISDSLFWAPTPARRVRVRLGLSRAAHVVALWEGAATTLQAHFGVAADRLTVIPNGVVSDRYAPVDVTQRAAARCAASLDGETFTVVYAGALVPEKGVDLVIEAVARVPSTQLLVAGDGPEAATLRALATRVAPGRVVFMPPETEAIAAYRAADVIALASRGGDSMPAVLIEAGLMEIPALATPVGAIPEIVRPDVTGVLVPVGDIEALARAIGALSANSDRVRALGRSARAHCLTHYSIEPIATAWERVLRTVADAGSR
jgi:glycosyltransferase involved in cell wall biosynthesis